MARQKSPIFLTHLLLLAALTTSADASPWPPPAHAAAARDRAPAAPISPAQSTALSPAGLAAWWDGHHVALPPPLLLTHADLSARLRAVQQSAPELFSLETIGQSVEGRAIRHLWFGRGPLHVLLWSQMHGDEATATSSLFDLFELVRVRRAEPAVTRLLDALTIHVVPMLNPDGAERAQRRNAQGLDVNRDALLLQSPEGRALKALRDRVEPAIGFNLHNQGWRTSVGTPPKPASISLLAVAYDEAGTENDGRRVTRRLCAVIRDAIEPMAPGQVGRYDEDFEVRAFGDNVTRWGTSVVLIETGAWAGPDPDPPLVRINFVALVAALDALATGRVQDADPARYDSLPRNGERLMHTIVRHATIVPGTGVAPFTGDVGVGAQRLARTVDGERRLLLAARIEDLGDLRVDGALEEIDGTGLTLAPLFAPDASPGDLVALPDWNAAPAANPILVGQPAQFLLLSPTDQPGAYRVERVIRVGTAPPER